MSKFSTIPAVAVESGQVWLALIESGNYAKAWDAAAASMHSCITQSDFEKGMQSIRAPLGKVVARDIKSERYVTHLPGLPEGDYWLVFYTTAFEKKPHADESVVLALEQDGKWRVAGYTLPDA